MSAGLFALSLVGMTGCPEAYGRGGRMDRAMRQDIEDQLVRHTCSDELWKRVCLSGAKLDDACLAECFE